MPTVPRHRAFLGDADAALNVEVKADIVPTGDRVRARFSASRRNVNVTRAGEMEWEAGRSYEGTWRLYWSTPRPRKPNLPRPEATPPRAPVDRR